MRYWFILLIFILVSCTSSAQENFQIQDRVKAERTLFKRSNAVLKTPTKYEMRQTEDGEYDPKPRVVEVDKKAGKYELRWIGYDGKEKIIEYQRSDSLDALVEASVKLSDTRSIYRYKIVNLPSSPSFVSEFIVQTFSSDIERERISSGDDTYVGHMASFIPQFTEGVWRRFAPLGEANMIVPGTNREFEIVSKAQPGLVRCYAGAAEPTLKGVGEHMPSELENAMPGFDELASCVTVGPDERLAKLSIPEKAKYLIDNLPKFVEAGWMAGNTPEIYKKILANDDLAEALKQARSDLDKEYITSEVFHIIEGLNN